MFTGFEILFLAFSGASAAGIASTRKVTRGAFAPTQYREYEEEPQVQRAHRQPQQQRHGGGEVHVKRIGGHFYVQAQIADVAYMALIDTGASDCFISHKVLREIGVDMRSIPPEKWTSTYHTANGPARAITVPLDITVMGIERQGVACSIMEKDFGGGPSANLIGMSFISTLSRCDPRGGTLIMRP